MSYFEYQIVAFIGWFVYGSFFEWIFHRELFHSPKWLRATFHAHAEVHHVVYGGDESYDLPSKEDSHRERVSMDWFAGPLFVIVHLPAMFLIQYLTGVPNWVGGCLAIGTYYTLYEVLHYMMHVPKDRWIERTRMFKFLNDHHRIHHRAPHQNLNVLIPLADLVLGTLRLPGRRAKKVAAKTADAAAQSKPRAAARMSQPQKSAE